MSTIGRESQLIWRAILVALGLLLAATYLSLAWPTVADCRAGDERACALRAVAEHWNLYHPLVDHARRSIVLDWTDGGRRAVQAAQGWAWLHDLAMPLAYRLVGIAMAILFAGIAAGYIIPSVIARRKTRGKNYKRGARIVTARALARLTNRAEPGGLTIASVPIPRALEPLSFRLAGSPGSGKSQVITRLIWEFRTRGDPAVIADAGGEFLAVLGLRRDTILNPFDARSVSWSPFAEIRSAADTLRLVKSLIPDAEGERAGWHQYAQQVLQITVDRLRATGRATNGWLAWYCCAAPREAWAELVENSIASRWFDPANERAFGSVAAVLATHITPISYLDPAAGQEAFSITEWIPAARENGAVLWLPYRADSRAAIATLMAAWLDLATNALMVEGSDRARRMFLVVDELAALGKIGCLADALAQGRKFGLVALAGYQTVSQLRDNYGEHGSKTLLACLQTKVVLSTADFESADALSKDLGEAEVAREERSTSGKIGDTASHTRREQRAVERAVLASEIQSLQFPNGYLKLAGDFPIARIKIEPIQFPRQRIAPWVPAPDRSTEIRRPAEPAPALPTAHEGVATPVDTAGDATDAADEIDDAALLAALNGDLDEDGDERSC